MNSTTKSTLERLDRTVWFDKVGEKDVPNCLCVPNWLAATANFASPEWEYVQLETLNILGQKVLSQSKIRYNQWNSHVIALKPRIDDLIRRKSDFVVRKEKLPLEFYGNIYADILGVVLETEYSDMVPLGFYGNVILDCYLKGHFPCGWKGEFPEGSLIVY